MKALLISQVAAALFAFAAACFWLGSARMKTPTSFPIHVVKPNEKPLGGEPFEGTYAGHGYSKELTDLGAALIGQSRLSARAAICATVSAAI